MEQFLRNGAVPLSSSDLCGKMASKMQVVGQLAWHYSNWLLHWCESVRTW